MKETEKTIFVVATHNLHKLKEFARILAPLHIEIVTPAQCGGEDIDPVEDGETFEDNAVIKATAFAKALGMPALADDSGICVDALGGAPGVYSARYSGGDDDDNNAFLLKNLEGVPFEKRTARYVCVICCARSDGGYFTVRGECEGRIGFEYRGENGFGYDPVFIPDEYPDNTVAELDDETKNAISHRGKALRAMADWLREYA